MTCTVFLSEHAQRNLDSFSDKVIKQILADCARLANDSIPDGKRIKKLQGWKENLYRLRAGDYRVVFKRSGTRIDIVRVLSKPDFQKAPARASPRTRAQVLLRPWDLSAILADLFEPVQTSLSDSPAPALVEI